MGRNSKKIALGALLVAIIGIGVGFAAFTRSLTIASTATVSPTDTFDVKFSQTNSSSTCTGTLGTGTTVSPTKTPTSLTAGTATLTNSGSGAPKATGLSASFTAPGQSVVYKMCVKNNSTYTAYLNAVTVGSKSCAATSGGGATASLVTAACAGISVSLNVAGTNYTSSNSAISSHSLAAGAAELVTFTITYAEGSDMADGPFNVTIGNFTLKYDTTD